MLMNILVVIKMFLQQSWGLKIVNFELARPIRHWHACVPTCWGFSQCLWLGFTFLLCVHVVWFFFSLVIVCPIKEKVFKFPPDISTFYHWLSWHRHCGRTILWKQFEFCLGPYHAEDNLNWKQLTLITSNSLLTKCKSVFNYRDYCFDRNLH